MTKISIFASEYQKRNNHGAKNLSHRYTEFRKPSSRRLCLCKQDCHHPPTGDYRSSLLPQPPRRLGKSLLISTLEAYFQGKRELFKGLALEQLEKDWVVRPVFHLDLNIGKYDAPDSLNDMLEKSLSKWESLYGADASERTFALRFAGVIERAVKKTGHRVAILVDEKPCNKSMRKDMHNLLKRTNGHSSKLV